MNIHIIRNGLELGPFTVDDINTHLRTGVFTPEDVARYEGSPALWPLLAVPGVNNPPAPTSPGALVGRGTFPGDGMGPGTRESNVHKEMLWYAIALLVILGFIGVMFAATSTSRARLSRSQWRQKLSANFQVAAGRMLLCPDQAKFLKVMGKADDTRQIGKQVYWYYRCSDGTVQLTFRVGPALTGGQLIADVSDY